MQRLEGLRHLWELVQQVSCALAGTPITNGRGGDQTLIGGNEVPIGTDDGDRAWTTVHLSRAAAESYPARSPKAPGPSELTQARVGLRPRGGRPRLTSSLSTSARSNTTRRTPRKAPLVPAESWKSLVRMVEIYNLRQVGNVAVSRSGPAPLEASNIVVSGATSQSSCIYCRATKPSSKYTTTSQPTRPETRAPRVQRLLGAANSMRAARRQGISRDR